MSLCIYKYISTSPFYLTINENNKIKFPGTEPSDIKKKTRIKAIILIEQIFKNKHEAGNPLYCLKQSTKACAISMFRIC